MIERSGVFVDGQWIESTGAGRVAVVNPATEQVIAQVPEGTPADVDAAVAAARRAFEDWSQTPVAERAAILERAHKQVSDAADELAAIISAEMGSPLASARQGQLGMPLATLSSMPGLLRDLPLSERSGGALVVREPVGVVGAITPWNVPLHQIAAKVIPALAAGCTVVLKPSEIAPLNALRFVELLQEAGVPDGVVNLVSGIGATAGEALVAHPDVDMISFTGSTRAGRQIAANAAATVKKVALELGGKSANVVLDDGDLAAGVNASLASSYANAGQVCVALSRLLVPKDRLDEAYELAVEGTKAFRVGDPGDPQTNIGPVASAAQRERVRDYIRIGVDEGARLLTGGAEAPDGLDTGYYVRPTVFGGVRPTMRIAQEEIFGPVLSIMGYANEADALALANGTIYGLSGAVWSADNDRAIAFARRMRTGMVGVNGARSGLGAPFGGYKQSGLGKELGHYGLLEFFELKSLGVPA